LCIIPLIASSTISSSVFAQPPVNPILACGSITKSGAYEVDRALTASATDDCIVISASNVTLNLNQLSITGAGGGAGIHVTRTAGNAFIEGGGATISGFVEGIEIDGPNAVVENFTVSNNGDAGVLLNGAKQAKVSNFAASGNYKDGVRLFKASMNVVQVFSAENNGRYGVWLNASSRNTIGGGFNVQDNAAAGIYLGCWGDGPNGQACTPRMAPSLYNYIFNGGAYATSGGQQRYGIAIDLADNFNKIANVTSRYNTSSVSPYYDVVDQNPDCGNNLWMSVEYGTTLPPPACAP
jgi:hypothetical protein